MASELLDRLHALEPAGAALAAIGPEPGVHVVGGAVRDVLLGREPVELDLVVEGDAAEVARRVAERVGGRIRVHARFATATVIAPSGSFDLASTRVERYPEPGALPEVRPGATLAEDLERRDFTVNAMAVAVDDGRMTAHPLALADLGGRLLRVLHAGSFRDDPTRLLRRCRYAARLRFATEAGTGRLASEAVAQRRLDTVSGERAGRELRLLAREPQPEGMLALAEHGLGSQLLHTAWDPAPHLVEDALGLAPADARGDLLALAATLVGVPEPELQERLRALGFGRGDRAAVVEAASGAGAVAAELTGGESARRWETLVRARPETVALAGALGGEPAQAAARRWLSVLRHRRLVVTGHDLREAGLSGPEVGDALRAATSAMYEREATGLESQLEAALAAARRA